MGIKNGIWPTMITPYTADGEVDYKSLERLVDWYAEKQVDGVFAVCQSSEMFFLTLEEKINIAKFVLEKAAGRFEVIASGHTSDTVEGQIEELSAMAKVGVKAVVMVTNRLCKQGESDEVWKANCQKILDAIPDVDFGFYECPYPFPRLFSEELLAWVASTGRFTFLKDTCCNMDMIAKKLKVLEGTQMKLFNANCATILPSLRAGASGFSGVMGNFHPELYQWLYRHFNEDSPAVERLSDYLGFSSVVECQLYPVNAKYFQMQEGVFDTYVCRSKDISLFAPSKKREIEQFYRINKEFVHEYKL